MIKLVNSKLHNGPSVPSNGFMCAISVLVTLGFLVGVAGGLESGICQRLFIELLQQ